MQALLAHPTSNIPRCGTCVQELGIKEMRYLEIRS
jgi:hypothetical protein